MRDMLTQRATFGQLQVKYGLKIDDNLPKDEYSFEGVSARIPGLVFEFTKDSADADTAADLNSLSGPASVMLPEYVGVAFDKIPGFVMDRGNGGHLNDSYGDYTITQSGGTLKSLAADASVYM